MAVLARRAALAGDRAVAAPVAVLAGHAGDLHRPAHPTRLLRGARILHPPHPAHGPAPYGPIPERVGPSRYHHAARLVGTLSHALDETGAGLGAGPLAFQHPAASIRRGAAVCRLDLSVAVAGGALRRDARLAAVSLDELQHGRRRHVVLVADPRSPSAAAGAAVAGRTRVRGAGGDPAADPDRRVHHLRQDRPVPDLQPVRARVRRYPGDHGPAPGWPDPVDPEFDDERDRRADRVRLLDQAGQQGSTAAQPPPARIDARAAAQSSGPDALAGSTEKSA